MRLTTFITVNYFLILPIILILGGFGAYIFLRHEIVEKTDFKLRDEKSLILDETTSMLDFSEEALIISSYIEIRPIANSHSVVEGYKDTVIIKHTRRRAIHEPYRQLRFTHTLDGRPYQITLRKNLVESRDLREALTRTMIGVISTLLAVLVGINFFISRSVWRTLTKTIRKINHYDLTTNEQLLLPESKFDELNELNQAVNKMSEQISNDYKNIKEFSENASHELQTPLAIIKSQIELLIQNEDLNENQMSKIQIISQETSRLAHLNQSLVLLTRIENRQYEDKADVNFKRLIVEQLKKFSELANLKEITFRTELHGTKIVRLNPTLAEILLKNLINNAIRYCSKPGEIYVLCNNEQFSITNPGAPLKMEPEQIFERFKKDQQSSQSLGLGLSIVKKICDLYSLDIQYAYHDNLHTFMIRL